MPTIDVHNHFIPMAAVDGARNGSGFDGLTTETVDGQEWLVHRQGYRYPLARGFYDLNERLRSMDERRIDQAVMSISPTMFMYGTPGPEATDFCRQANDEMAAFGKASGGRLHPVAALPMQDPGLAVTELRRAVNDLGMRGAQIGPQIEGTWLDQGEIRTVLATAQDLGVPLILHPYYTGSKPGLEDFYMTNLVGNPLDTAVCATRLILSGLLDEMAGLAVVLMHGGGYLPYQVGRLDHGHKVRPETKRPQHAPSSYLHRFWYDTITHAPRPLQFLVGLVGADNVVYGTDYPYDMGAGPLDEQLAGTGLPAEAVGKIAGANAAKLFGLPAA